MMAPRPVQDHAGSCRLYGIVRCDEERLGVSDEALFIAMAAQLIPKTRAVDHPNALRESGGGTGQAFCHEAPAVPPPLTAGCVEVTNPKALN